MEPQRWVARLWVRFWDLLFPPRCVGCGAWGEYLCPQCGLQVTLIEPPYCVRCGQPWRAAWGPPGGVCPRCQRYPPAYRQARSYALMEGVVRQAVHELKYQRQWGWGEVMAEWLTWLVQREGWPIEAVVPVPLSQGRLQARGYNQAAWLAYPVARRLGVPYRGHALERFRETASQVGLGVAERWHNVAGAFRPRGDLPFRAVLLVDDVMTTGATLHAAAQALLRFPAVEAVWAVTVARAALQKASRL